LLLFFKQQLTNKLELFLQSSQYLSQLLTGIINNLLIFCKQLNNFNIF
jgi:hypothetical protein